MKLALGWLLVACLAGCASTGGSSSADVQVQVSDEARFDTYQTYSWLTRPEGAKAEGAQFIVDAIDAQLQQRGWRKAENADIAVRVQVATADRQTIEPVYNAAGGGYGWMAGMGSMTTRAVAYREGTMVVDLFDTASKRGVWRATVSGALPSSQAHTKELVDGVIRDMFAKLPAGS
ncbi:uncharacterized protein DUF4136 [Luteimonas cucumeris]|uniref:Uncharacterized protein DUF4136 n=1 Tax=Luteimonas cucumeris TaxID=985012 RepID=A0A562L2K9_9GAMM|nr:DUF4136 domain-containing protein [Luteimonas cucumeris]TWI01900.1 uncharacterized protein DUF4136 [Luteimonas cucumeris]